MILLIGGEKGGTGKSMLASNLAAWLAISGRDVLLLDADPQMTASKWVNRRNKHYPFLPKVHNSQATGDIFENVRDKAKRYQDVVIDTGGRDSTELRTAMTTAHKLLTVVQPSQADIETLPRLQRSVREAKTINRNLKTYVVINRASPNPMVYEAQETRELLESEQHDFEFIPVIFRDYKIFRDANAKGLSVLEESNAKARAALQLLAQALFLSKKETAQTDDAVAAV